MKKLFSVLIVLLFASGSFVNADEVALRFKNSDAHPERPRVPAYIPVTAFLEDDELTFDFDPGTGTAYITITDENSVVVYSYVLDTSSQQELVALLGGCDAGEYVIDITIGSIELTGEFTL